MEQLIVIVTIIIIEKMATSFTHLQRLSHSEILQKRAINGLIINYSNLKNPVLNYLTYF